jgi:hypothetical protein
MSWDFKESVMTSALIMIAVLLSLNCSDDKVSNSNVPAAPTNLIGHALTPSSIIIYWADNSNNETSFLVYRREVDTDWVQIAAAPQNWVTYTDSLLRDTTSYWYYVVARNAIGSSAATGTVTIATFVLGTFPSIPNEPYPANGSEVQPPIISLAWQCTDLDNDPLLFDVYFGIDSMPPLIQTNLAGDSFEVDNLQYNTTYYWKVVAEDNDNHLAISPLWNFSTPSPDFWARFDLIWGADPRDLDFHLWTPIFDGDTLNSHIYFNRTGNSDIPPYATLDMDDVDGFGPEMITLHQIHPGAYVLAVFHYSGSGTVATSEAEVTVTHNDGTNQVINLPADTAGVQPNWWWHVCMIDGATGLITPLNIFSPDPPRPDELFGTASKYN